MLKKNKIKSLINFFIIIIYIIYYNIIMKYIIIIVILIILILLGIGVYYYYYVMDKKDNDTDFCLSSQTNQVYPEEPILDTNNQDDTQQDNKEQPEVFNIENNIFTYYDAPAICKAYGAELATFNQVKDAYNKGANWCNYGWTKGQMALYPTQYESWKKLQQGPPEYRKVCGRPGLNGGYFENANLKFGVNCYGIKPKPKENEDIQNCNNNSLYYYSEFDEKVEDYKRELQDYKVLPFNKKEWSDN